MPLYVLSMTATTLIRKETLGDASREAVLPSYRLHDTINSESRAMNNAAAATKR